jgi:ectoine hydroxylase-related dioxygenase (phytanoyl-CoA dioxygenase family)
MRSVDVRTRTGADVRPVDAATFFGDELPSLLADRRDLALPGARQLHPRALGFDVDGQAWTLALTDDAISVTPGLEDAVAVVRLDAIGLHDIVNDLRTPMGFLTGGDLDMPSGRLEDFLDWSVVLRAVLDGQRAHVAGDVTFRDADGEPLDLGQGFAVDDDPEAISHFLGEAGFVHLRRVFTEEEMAAVSADMDAAAAHYEQGDGRSWWARTHAGEDRLVRMQYFQTQSPAAAAVLADDRLQSIGRLTADGHRHGKPGGNTNLVEALVKPIGIVEGISDVPWHKDCSLGSHSYRCCSLTVGISVTGAGPESGQLRVVAGSHRALIQPAFVRRDLDLPQLDLPTETGDVTVHPSCTLHMSQPPVSRERRVLYTDFNLPTDEGARSPNEAVLKRIREGAPTTVNQPRGHVAAVGQVGSE